MWVHVYVWSCPSPLAVQPPLWPQHSFPSVLFSPLLSQMVYQNAQLVAGANILTLALSTIGWVSMVSGQACFTVKAGGEVTTLLAHAAVHTRAVSIALACWEIKGTTLSLDFLHLRWLNWKLKDIDTFYAKYISPSEGSLSWNMKAATYFYV